ncbi:MAG: NAD-binding protein [Cyanobacteria bacterium NC_groundwater_1444_Ag_S-0.65um_54_12]|nr:NAD-binding protein [Cyanobacteria bacterium NC_groundwater_1444_Ag_S-0.65um_54_12]
MYILVVGGGKIGYHLVRTLLSEGHEVALIEKDIRVCEQIAERFDVMVQHGDGTSPALLAEAGCQRADVVVAVAGRDQDNLVVCQVAKDLYDAGRSKPIRTIARINDPRNEELFRLQGVDALISVTAAVANMIDLEITPHSMVHYLTMQHGHLIMVEVTLADDSPAVGQTIANLNLPADTILVTLARQGKVMLPAGHTILESGDEVVAITNMGQQTEVRRLLVGERVPVVAGGNIRTS